MTIKNWKIMIVVAIILGVINIISSTFIFLHKTIDNEVKLCNTEASINCVTMDVDTGVEVLGRTSERRQKETEIKYQRLLDHFGLVEFITPEKYHQEGKTKLTSDPEKAAWVKLNCKPKTTIACVEGYPGACDEWEKNKDRCRKLEAKLFDETTTTSTEDEAWYHENCWTLKTEDGRERWMTAENYQMTHCVPCSDADPYGVRQHLTSCTNSSNWGVTSNKCLAPEVAKRCAEISTKLLNGGY